MPNYPVSAKYALVIRSVAIDKVATPEGQSGKVLGGAASYASIACSYFAPTRLVGIVGADFPKAHLERYRSHDIDLDGLTIRVLGLAALIQTKEEAGRDKDRAVLELLRQALRGYSRLEPP